MLAHPWHHDAPVTAQRKWPRLAFECGRGLKQVNGVAWDPTRGGDFADPGLDVQLKEQLIARSILTG